MINFLLWLVAGGVLGSVANFIMLTQGSHGIFASSLVGSLGAALGGWFLSPMVGLADISQREFSGGALLAALVGAIVVLSVFNVFRPGPVR